MSKKKRQSWSKETRVDDVTREVRVEALDNGGFLVNIRKSWYDKKEQWHNEETKLYSESNPLEPEVDVDPIDAMYAALKGK